MITDFFTVNLCRMSDIKRNEIIHKKITNRIYGEKVDTV